MSRHKLISEFVTLDELRSYIKEQFGEILFVFPVLHFRHEGDNYGYIVEKNGERIVLLSENDKLYVATKSELEAKISKYTEIIFDTKKAVTLLR
jgi:hypothetical protein